MKKDQVLTIKRFQNQKFYNPQECCYLTIEEVEKLISKQKVKVIDNRSNKDITNEVLIYLIWQNKKPVLMQMDSMALTETLKKAQNKRRLLFDE